MTSAPRPTGAFLGGEGPSGQVAGGDGNVLSARAWGGRPGCQGSGRSGERWSRCHVRGEVATGLPFCVLLPCRDAGAPPRPRPFALGAPTTSVRASDRRARGCRLDAGSRAVGGRLAHQRHHMPTL